MSNDICFKEALARCRTLFDRAEKLPRKDPLAMSLATVDAAGRPSVRMVLLRGFDERGFVFYTNSESRKGPQLASNPQAGICFYWEELREQLRVEGVVEKVGDTESDAYWETRSHLSQLAAKASKQSAVLSDRQLFEDEVQQLGREFPGAVPRPDLWYGFRVVPDRIEFWAGREGRMHERTLYERGVDHWTQTVLYP